MSNKVFDYMLEEGGEKIDLFVDTEIDMSGESYSPKKRWGVDTPFIDPDARKELHERLPIEGIVNPFADAFDAALYASEGKFGNMVYAAAAIVPGLDFVKNAKLIWKAFKGGEEIITLRRGVHGIDKIEDLISIDKKGKAYVVGNWKKTTNFVTEPQYAKAADGSSRRVIDNIQVKTGPGKSSENFATMVPTVPAKTNIDNLLFTTADPNYAKRFAEVGYQKSGLIVEFKIPKSYVEKYGRATSGGSIKNMGGYNEWTKDWLFKQHPNVIFTKGLPIEYVAKIDNVKGKGVFDYLKETLP